MRKLITISALALAALCGLTASVSAHSTSHPKVTPLSQIRGCYGGPAYPGCSGNTSKQDVRLSIGVTSNGVKATPHVGIITFYLSCLGVEPNSTMPRLSFLQLLHSERIDPKTDRFSYHGRISNSDPAAGPSFESPLTLSGQFTSRTSATLTVTLGFKSCGTQHFKLRTTGDPTLPPLERKR
jgi:hypothetical protein